jgi:hypothetical protein
VYYYCVDVIMVNIGVGRRTRLHDLGFHRRVNDDEKAGFLSIDSYLLWL